MEIEALTPDRYREAAGVLARAFEHDPLTAYVLPRPAARAPCQRWLYERWLRVVGPMGGAFMAKDGSGVAIWWPPGGRAYITLGALLRAGLGWTPFRMGLRYTARMIRTARDIETNHYPGFGARHWYLDILGVDPQRQRTGVGGALIRHITDRADRDGIACTVVTHYLANVPYYERFGFQLLKQTILAPGIHASSLRREPGAERASV